MRTPVTRKRRRLYAVLAGLTMLGVAAALVLVAFEDNIVFFYGPSDLKEKSLRPGQTVRLGGLVVSGSVKKAADGVTTIFSVTDLNQAVQIRFTGLLPDLFREGQGIVSEGTLGPDGVFTASSVLAKVRRRCCSRRCTRTMTRSSSTRRRAMDIARAMRASST